MTKHPARTLEPNGASDAPTGDELRVDDFVCLRYAIPYPSIDCAIRTKFRTSPGCDHCEQGRFNLKRHEARLQGVRFPYTRLR